jgi:hypothetical protein
LRSDLTEDFEKGTHSVPYTVLCCDKLYQNTPAIIQTQKNEAIL